ncbi:hypothetical protein [Paenibacillus flagellatus]|uniref:Uncharacterized protein n=1 Tax=Paenibacillus flagellatus TaxID=2211139 RepID=A0A2V5KS60_9BACL|nr:hypothetical protein [Paenibacillus flagellatus]PYI54397.1 hypothetical protein DLM86_13065 [Paenibacillus flagellatus]
MKTAENAGLERTLRIVDIPDEYEFRSAHDRRQNGEDVRVVRHEKKSGVNNGLGGEHVSFTVERTGMRLLGYTRIDAGDAEGPLPDRERTAAIASAFLDRVEPGLSLRLRHLWTDRHDERVTVVRDGRRVTVPIPCMKYKCYSEQDDSYAWVIVGAEGRIVSFEQGMVWRDGRVTEKWLHDSWIAERMKGK